MSIHVFWSNRLTGQLMKAGTQSGPINFYWAGKCYQNRHTVALKRVIFDNVSLFTVPLAHTIRRYSPVTPWVFWAITYMYAPNSLQPRRCGLHWNFSNNCMEHILKSWTRLNIEPAWRQGMRIFLSNILIVSKALYDC